MQDFFSSYQISQHEMARSVANFQKSQEDLDIKEI